MSDKRDTIRANSQTIPLTVVMPAYNEEGAIGSAVNEVREQVLDKIAGANMVIVNDGSKDGTGKILDELAKADPRLIVIHQVNMGHGPSLVRALGQAKGDYVLLVDSDMQIPLVGFMELWKLTDTMDAIFGIRFNRQDPPHRIVLSAMAAWFLGALFEVKLPDSNAPFKIVKRDIWREMISKVGEENLFTPSIFLAVYAKKHRYKVLDVQVPHRNRTSGKGSLNLRSLLRFCFNGLRQVIQYRERLS